MEKLAAAGYKSASFLLCARAESLERAGLLPAFIDRLMSVRGRCADIWYAHVLFRVAQQSLFECHLRIQPRLKMYLRNSADRACACALHFVAAALAQAAAGGCVAQAAADGSERWLVMRCCCCAHGCMHGQAARAPHMAQAAQCMARHVLMCSRTSLTPMCAMHTLFAAGAGSVGSQGGAEPEGGWCI
jgi:hypothetical protein